MNKKNAEQSDKVKMIRTIPDERKRKTENEMRRILVNLSLIS